jgi:hypothetical protein
MRFSTRWIAVPSRLLSDEGSIRRPDGLPGHAQGHLARMLNGAGVKPQG